MTFLLLTRLPRGPQSSQWLISTVWSVSDPVFISHPICTHSKESEVPQMSQTHAGQSLFYPTPPPTAYSCCVPLLQAARPAWYFFLLLAPKYAPLCTFISCCSLCQGYFVRYLQWCPTTSFPQRVGISLFFTALAKIEKEIKPDPLRVGCGICEAQLF